MERVRLVFQAALVTLAVSFGILILIGLIACTFFLLGTLNGR